MEVHQACVCFHCIYRTAGFLAGPKPNVNLSTSVIQYATFESFQSFQYGTFESFWQRTSSPACLAQCVLDGMSRFHTISHRFQSSAQQHCYGGKADKAKPCCDGNKAQQAL